MEKKLCACTRIRSCLICNKKELYHPTHIDSMDASDVPGLYILPDFLSVSEEQLLQSYFDGESIIPTEIDGEECSNIDIHEFLLSKKASKWIDSQSGRRKQDYGPKVNFQKRKIKIDQECKPVPYFLRKILYNIENGARGACSHDIQQEIQREMTGFDAIEVVALDYQPERGAHIEPHLDDVWAWGPRIVGINLLSDAEMLFIQAPSDKNSPERIVKVVIPARSIYILSKESRYIWEHAIAASMVKNRRISFTFREISQEIMREEPQIAHQLIEMNRISEWRDSHPASSRL